MDNENMDIDGLKAVFSANPGESTDANTPPEKIGEIPYDQFSEATKQYFGREVTPDYLNELESYREKYQSLSTNYSKLEEESKLSPFANEHAKTINDLMANGATPDIIGRYISLGTRDIDSMSEREVFAQKLAIEHKNKLSAEDINALVEKELKLPADDEGNINPADKAALNLKILEAKNFLREKQIAYKETDSTKSDEQNAKAFESLANGWTDVGGQMFDNRFQKIEMPINVGEGKEAEVFTFDVPKDVKDEVVNALSHTLASNGTPLAKSSAEGAMELMSKLVFAKMGKAMVEQAYVKGMERSATSTTKKLSGLTATGTGSTLQTEEGELSGVDELRARNLGLR